MVIAGLTKNRKNKFGPFGPDIKKVGKLKGVAPCFFTLKYPDKPTRARPPLYIVWPVP